MARKTASGMEPREKSPAQSTRAVPPKSQWNGTVKKNEDYTSDGVSDQDIFLLPASDWQTLGLLTAVATVVRLFRIYQPSSVVFDEVQ